MGCLYINSEYLQLAEPLMEKYYDFHSSMLYDEIKHCVENSGIDYKQRINGIITVDSDQSFRENKDLTFVVTTPYKKSITEEFSSYFDIPLNPQRLSFNH